ncbi:MAG: glutamyl-tRNA reductase [Kiloniellales bacterium]
MAGPPHSLSQLLLVGLSRRSATAALTGELFVDDLDVGRFLSTLSAAKVGEGLAIATCERLELLAVARDPAATADILLTLLATEIGITPEDLAAQHYRKSGQAALEHLFGVAASLDSEVLGEPSILGQLKASHRAAAAAGLIGPLLEAALQGSYAAAKRIRRETALAERPVSLSSAALRVARDLHGNLDDCRAVVLGLGEMAELLARDLKDGGVGHLTVVHPNRQRAALAARQLGGHLRPWEEMEEALAAAEIVVTALSREETPITVALASRVLRARQRQPVLFIDVALPGDVEARVNDLDGAFVYRLEDLERIADAGRSGREAGRAAAWGMIREELAAFEQRAGAQAAGPALAALRRHVEALREEVLADRRLDTKTATRLLLGRLLHDPSAVLREAAARDSAEAAKLEAALMRLFRLTGRAEPTLDEFLGRTHKPGREEDD